MSLGLGSTVPELGDLSGMPVIAKTRFSMITPELEKVIPIDTKSILLCGIETHVCIQQTALDFAEKGLDVHIIADACSSRNMVDR
ncbi:unnamed protein product [Protopolystoma xenopodis]|uniref:Isochorismatase-like domain-containing protein n=1 Tax=Protopolystoma xenopodis TaxID=117903 RepID=A0A448X9C3_9PLAT|nr:unnamed protein product [Protopolystoma xenopodis]